MLSVTTSVIKKCPSRALQFLVGKLVMCQPLAEEGLNFVNFPAEVKALHLAWISRSLSNYRDSRKAIPNQYVSTHGGLQFLLKCNYNAACISNNLPIFFREFLQFFQEFKNKPKIYSYGNSLLWYLEILVS